MGIEKRRIYVEWNKKNAPKKCITRIEQYINQGINNLEVIAPKKTKTYPNVCVPVAAIFEWYESKGVKFNYIFRGDNNYVKHTCLHEPLVAEKLLNSSEMKFALDKVWKYSTPEGVNALVTAIVNAVRESDVLEEGNLIGAEWCINEIMDNQFYFGIK